MQTKIRQEVVIYADYHLKGEYVPETHDTPPEYPQIVLENVWLDVHDILQYLDSNTLENIYEQIKEELN